MTWHTWIHRAAKVSNDLIHNRAHWPISLQPLEETLVPEPAQLSVAQLPRSCLDVPHHLNLKGVGTLSSNQPEGTDLVLRTAQTKRLHLLFSFSPLAIRARLMHRCFHKEQ